MADEHECPYEGMTVYRLSPDSSWENIVCGEAGWLCNRCKEEMANARQRELFAFSKDLDAKRVAEIRAVTTHQIAERFEEVSLRLDDTWKHFDERLSALEAAFAAHGKPYGGD